jgi:HprK-related kinase A
MAAPLLEWGLNRMVASRAHQYLILHAAAAERGGRGLILPAPPGSGKSTLSAALAHRGWRLLSDEFALIRPADGRLVPLPRPVSLKDASIDVIHAFAPAAVLGPRVADTVNSVAAYMRPPGDSVSRAQETALPAWIVFPRFQSGASTVLTPLPRARAFFRLAENAFNYTLLGKQGFDTLARAIEASESFEFLYSNLDEAVELFASLADRHAAVSGPEVVAMAGCGEEQPLETRARSSSERGGPAVAEPRVRRSS